MRKLIGVLLLIAGTGGLAYWASMDHAVRIERAITAQADVLAGEMQPPLTVAVSGRDVTVTGVVETSGQLDTITTVFGAIDGLRVLDVSGVDLLPVVSPFVVSVLKDDTGELVAEGVLPNEDARRVLGGIDGQAFADLALAAGAPDGDWTQALVTGLDGLSALPSGALTVSDRTVTLDGTVAGPLERDALIGVMQALPAGFVFEDRIDVLDDGRPPSLDVRRSGEIIRATGKLPSDMALAEVTDRFPTAALDIDQARIPAAQTDWPTMASTGLDALALLDEGRLQIEGQTINISGRGTPDALSQVTAMLGDVPSTYTVAPSLDVTDDGAPLRLTIDFTGTTVTASGKYPADFTPRSPLGLPLTDTGRGSFVSSETFAANADAGVAALGQLQNGTLVVTEETITLTGQAASPQIGSVIDGLLDGAPATITRDITYIDDGSPAAWSLTYSAETGASVEGRLPTTLSADDLTAALGVRVLGSPTVAAEDDNPTAASDILTIAADVLPELERLTLSADGAGMALDLVTSPSVDIDLLATDLAQRLPPDVAFSIQPVAPLPQQGSARINAATGLAEVFLDGFWIPDLDFSTTLDGCSAQSRAILEAGQINFLSGSARLDATSIRTINALAAVAKPCVEADLDLEVSGHTDASGDADQNQILSQDRAAAVRAALVDRGVPARAITAIGFGAQRPVASNDTPEGRTLNRRTEIDWFEKGALRDP
ncbi:OmpA family protein [Pseudooctadecabacter sp.]|uniref:OmpA family protein n=1 Tax=Pseudooctadecabacter sp. TaxID=1966338 RepID=UPI0035C8032C